MPNHDIEKEVAIELGPISLQGSLNIPKNATGIVLFAHGSGSSRLSPRNRFVAEALNKKKLATLLFDLLTEDEESVDVHTREFRFNIKLLAERLIGSTDWVLTMPETQSLNIGYFGSSTGAAAALIAGAQRIEAVKAIVSRGGRVDLAGEYLNKVVAPTLLIVGEYDYTVIELNQQAMDHMTAEVKLQIVPAATHLFEEPGALDQVIHLAEQWFEKYLVTSDKNG